MKSNGLIMIIVILLYVVIGCLSLYYVLISNTDNGETYKHPVITEYDFSIGNIENTKECIYANPCNDKVLYPISEPNVDYDSTYPSNCKCLEFIETP